MDVKVYIDINCDMGEGFPQDDLLFPLISSCNIACGGHAGDAESMKRTIALALKHQVQIGAHPSYPDRENFGRAKMDISNEALFESIAEQFANLQEVARIEGANIRYLKPHGALYNVLNKELLLGEQLLPFLKDLGIKKILGLPYSEMAMLAEENEIEFIKEGFADRTYTKDGALVSRKIIGAVIEKPEKAKAQVSNMLIDKFVMSLDNERVAMDVQTICIHSDTKSAHDIALALDTLFEAEKIERRAF